ncbi:unnamed protein product [Caenorhabditis angaria]|uniref:Exonuclease domain-containing protein n=1 Tax=Caenorhabditis angaria TaxID=860376 RepID=A0A9P1J876_9PELO|nr:unnamed protein product [Caenorhabditis angaria]
MDEFQVWLNCLVIFCVIWACLWLQQQYVKYQREQEFKKYTYYPINGQYRHYFPKKKGQRKNAKQSPQKQQKCYPQSKTESPKKNEPELKLDFQEYIKIHEYVSKNLLISKKNLQKLGFPYYERKNLKSVKINPTKYNRAKKMWVAEGEKKRICCRCQMKFRVDWNGKNANEKCVHHPLRKVFDEATFQDKHPCCNRNIGKPGCITNNLHVFDQLCVSVLKDFTVAPEVADIFELKSVAIFAFDCEMVYTDQGPALARLSVVDWFGKLFLDVRVRPSGILLDPNTRFSGLTARDVENAQDTSETCREKLFEIINQDSILVGHSLECDLKALRLSHNRIVDTSLLFQTGRNKPSLRYLAQSILGKSIQEDRKNKFGHDSEEDARTCIELLRYYIENNS